LCVRDDPPSARKDNENLNILKVELLLIFWFAAGVRHEGPGEAGFGTERRISYPYSYPRLCGHEKYRNSNNMRRKSA
jgi:hypothetical protein